MALLKPASIVSIFYLNILILSIQGNPAFPDLLCHGQRNSTLLKQILNIGSGDEVPEYEIIQLRILSKRSAEDQNVILAHLSAFEKDIHLQLQRNDDFNDRVKNAKFFNAKLTDTGVQLTEEIVEDDDPGMPYIDPVQMTAVIIRYGPYGELQMDGVIGDDLLIKPAPMDINFPADYFSNDWDFSDESGDRLNSSEKDPNKFFGCSSSDTTKSGVHIVYRRSMKSETSLKVALDDVIRNINSTDDERHHKQPLHAWPEVLLMVDYDSYAMHVSHGFNKTQIKRYYISFFYGVDLRFRVISDPKISLILSYLVVFRSRDSTPFLKDNILPNRNLLMGYRVFGDLSRYLYSIRIQQNFPKFDVAVFLTKLDMCLEKFIFCIPRPIGIAAFRGACNVNHEEKRWLGAAIIEDEGGFDGILTAAHEIGHLLGLTHDGDSHYSQGALYSPVCNNEGYIMSTHSRGDREFEWSECSIKQFRRFLRSKDAACLFNQPSYPNELEVSELPGAVLSLDEQCRRIWGTRAYASDSRVCAGLQCHQPMKTPHVLVLPPAADGSSCGENLHCRYGKCVPKYVNNSHAWTTMTPVHNVWKSTTRRPPTVRTTRRPPTVRTTRRPTVSTTKKPPSMEEDCTEDKDKLFCWVFFIFRTKEACKDSRALEKCCNSVSIFCNARYS